MDCNVSGCSQRRTVLSAAARRLTVRWVREIWKGVDVVVDPWIVQAVFLVAGAEPAQLARWMGENVATTTLVVGPVEPQDTTRSARTATGAALF